ncbi:MAG: DUF4835 family protein [Crocinitomicaceae bacterium]|jgi:hypothetical protein|nr:DUF4835 family protein [Crocinitomicaceae bacterium]
MKFLVAFILVFSGLVKLFAQEFNCQVSVLTDAKVEVSSTEQDIIKQMKQSVYDFMNNTQWTVDQFKTEERINLNIQIQIKTIPSTGNYTGYIQIQYNRPAFNSNYNSPLFNFQDENVAFSFSRNAVLLYNENQFKDNLTSILAFYAYFVLGMDYDSFSLKGGSQYFSKAQQIVTNAQVSGAAGWNATDQKKRNRYWMVENILQPAFEPLRECNYMFHRKGIDQLYENKVAAKKAMFDALNKLTPIVQRNPNNFNTLNFLNSKILEFKNVLSDSEIKEKTDFVNLLKKLDSGNSTLYQEILN